MAEQVLDEEWDRVRDISKHVLHMIANTDAREAERWARVRVQHDEHRATLRGAAAAVVRRTPCRTLEWTAGKVNFSPLAVA